MPIHIKSIFLGLFTAAAFSVLASNSFAQHSGPVVLAAKQAIKNKVVSAMSDGKITEAERRSILLKANEVCTEREYMGLVETMNRLSPMESATPESLGQARYVDKKLITYFPSGDIPLIDDLPNQLPILKSYSKQLAARESMPGQNYVVTERVVKQPTVKKTLPYQSYAQATTLKQSVVKSTSSNNAAVKTTVQKQNATQKVAMLPPPPTPKKDIQSESKSAEREENKISKIDVSASNKSTSETTKSNGKTDAKPVKSKVVNSQEKQPATGNRVTLEQPNKLWDKAEKSAVRTTYTDYSVPVLNTPAAALLTSGKVDTIQASYSDIFEPETRSDIVGR